MKKQKRHRGNLIKYSNCRRQKRTKLYLREVHGTKTSATMEIAFLMKCKATITPL
jgi:hypothetical protein